MSDATVSTIDNVKKDIVPGEKSCPAVSADDMTKTGSINEGDLDDVIIRANGHEAAMQRQFKWISALGLAFSITNSWVGYLVSNSADNHARPRAAVLFC